jgi:hypothetical protein
LHGFVFALLPLVLPLPLVGGAQGGLLIMGDDDDDDDVDDDDDDVDGDKKHRGE